MPGGGKKKQGLSKQQIKKDVKIIVVVFLELTSGVDAIKAPDRKKYEEDVESVMNEIKDKNALLVSFYSQPRAVFLFLLLFKLTGWRKQKNIQKPPGEQIATNSPDVSSELKQVSALKKGVLEKIQEIDKQMKDLAKQVTTKVSTAGMIGDQIMHLTKL